MWETPKHKKMGNMLKAEGKGHIVHFLAHRKILEGRWSSRPIPYLLTPQEGSPCHLPQNRRVSGERGQAGLCLHWLEPKKKVPTQSRHQHSPILITHHTHTQTKMLWEWAVVRGRGQKTKHHQQTTMAVWCGCCFAAISGRNVKR